MIDLRSIDFRTVNRDTFTLLGNRVILRYTKEQMDNAILLSSGLYISKVYNDKVDGTYCAVEAEVWTAGVKSPFKQGDKVAVSHRISYDEVFEGAKVPNNWYLCTLEDGSELRWAYDTDICAVTNNGVEPVKGTVFCEPNDQQVETFSEKSKLYLVSLAPNTDNEAFKVKIAHIHPDDEAELDVHVGDTVWCPKKSEIQLELQGKSYWRVRAESIVALAEHFTNSISTEPNHEMQLVESQT